MELANSVLFPGTLGQVLLIPAQEKPLPTHDLALHHY